MTEREFDLLKWELVNHMSQVYHHSSIYKVETPTCTVYRCTCVPYRNGEPSRRGGTVHYMIDGDKTVYKSKDSILKAINNL